MAKEKIPPHKVVMTEGKREIVRSLLAEYDKRKGKHIEIFENRNSVLEKAKLKHSERWGSRNTKRYEVRKVEVLNPDERKIA